MPNGWAVTTIGFITILTSGADLQKSKFRNNPPGIPYVTGASNFSDGLISINRYVDSSFKNSAFGDVFLTCKGTIGEIAINQIGDCHVARQIMSLRPFIDCDFLVLLLQKNISKYKEEGRSQIPGIGRKNVLTTKVALPPLKEQSRIAAKVASIFQVLASLQKAQDRYQKLRGLLKAKILSLAVSGRLLSTENATIKSDDKNYYKNLSRDWPEKTLSEIADCFIGLTYKPVDIVPKNGTTILRSNNIQGGRLFLPGTIEVTTRIPDKLFLRDDDILICSRNGSSNLVGKCCLISGLTKKASFGAFMTVCRVFSGLPKFIYYFMQSGKFRSQIRPNANTTTINQLTTNILKNVKIPFPPTEQQEKVVRKLDELSLLLIE